MPFFAIFDFPFYMAMLERTVEAFPSGRTTEELLALLDIDFDPLARNAVISELHDLQSSGRIRRGRDGRWRSTRMNLVRQSQDRTVGHEGRDGIETDVLFATPARFSVESVELPRTEEAATEVRDTKALIRYFRSALRADPRGAITQHADRHGVSWQLLTGSGPLTPDHSEQISIKVELDSLPNEFRQALAKREANEQSLALGWPLAVIRQRGVPTVCPVGLIAAEWERNDDYLIVTVSSEDVIVNPAWLRAAARSLGWSDADLRKCLEGSDGNGMPLAEFRSRLREAAASAVRGALTSNRLSAELDLRSEGVHSAVGMFLPTDTTFTAGAVRDLDIIASWSADLLSETALGGLFEGTGKVDHIPALNIGPLNAEQIDAVRQACTRPLTVVTGPPGTGKSQAITAMVASVLSAGGSVLVASKNHQALDAVEERLTNLAPKASYAVRTLDPIREIDESFMTALESIIREIPAESPDSGHDTTNSLRSLVNKRDAALDAWRRHDELRCELANVIERIALHSETKDIASKPVAVLKRPWWMRLLTLLGLRNSQRKSEFAHSTESSTSLLDLCQRRSELQAEITSLEISEDPVTLTETIARHATALVPRLLATRCVPNEDQRQNLALAKVDAELTGRIQLGRDIANTVVKFRPLWLASVLGTPKRVPLEPAIFDLVIFDEASQCDIASALPLFARAKRAVVVGDDRQLPTIPHLGIAQDRNLMLAQGLQIGGMGRYAQSRQSLFDLANTTSGAARILLRDQYRSSPEIVDYISENFYGGKLRPAGLPDRFVTPKAMRAGLVWTNVNAPTLPERGNVNRAEVDAIAGQLATLIIKEGYRGTIGVITPFRPQVAALSNAVSSRVSDTLLEEVSFRVGTVDSFQGQERDLIMFSPCVGPSSAITAVQFIQKDWRRINVAISRAKAISHIFGDLNFALSGKVSSLQRLASRATEQRRKRLDDGKFDSKWERRVYHALKARNLEPNPQYEVAGRRLDFALFGQGEVKLDLEIDGRHWHMDTDGRRKQSDLWRDHMLRSLGWRIRRFWVDELSDNMEKCIDLVERDLA